MFLWAKKAINVSFIWACHTIIWFGGDEFNNRPADSGI